MTNANESPLAEIYHYEKLTDWLGTSGQPNAQQFASIADAGYGAVVNLAMADSDRAIPQEGNIVAGLGMTYVHLPVRFEAPSIENLRSFFGIMDALSSERVWVHCVVNARVSAFAYQYLRLRRGFEERAARTKLLDRWEPEMDDVWQKFLSFTKDDVTPEQL